jgi:hypothetical protein
MQDDPHYTGPHRWPEPIGLDRTFATSNFRKAYGQVAPIPDQLGVYSAVYRFLLAFAKQRGLTSTAHQTCTKTFYSKLRDETVRRVLQPVVTATPETGGAAEAAVHLLGQVGAAAELIWTSELVWEGMGPYEREFCSLLNEALREDEPELVTLAAEVVRAVNELCVVKRSDPGVLTRLDECQTFRGGGFDDEHQGFFTVGKKYRYPGFFATSENEGVADEFIDRAMNPNTGGVQRAQPARPGIKWVVNFDPRGRTDPRFRCKHVNFVKNSHVVCSLTGEPRESEFLFAPYSVFTVLEVRWGRPYHRVVIQAAVDNKLEPEDLPLAPWG